MNKCIRCSNEVPEGRVVTMCDGCLALAVYGRALDRIVELVDAGQSAPARIARIRAIAMRALKSVPRRSDETVSE